MVRNLHHLGEGTVRLRLTSGRRVTVSLRHNDRANEVLWVEPDEGIFEPVPYAAVAAATVPLTR